jgi:hypothetical protein
MKRNLRVNDIRENLPAISYNCCRGFVATCLNSEYIHLLKLLLRVFLPELPPRIFLRLNTTVLVKLAHALCAGRNWIEDKASAAKELLSKPKNKSGEWTHFSVGELKTRLDKLAAKRDTLLKNGGGDSLTTRLNSAYRDNLHSRRLTAAKYNKQVQDESGNGKPSGSSLIATDAYGRPVRPVNPLKNFKGPMSVKAREQLAIQHAVQEAAWRTADAQWRAENPNLVGRDVASLDRGTFMMSEQARGIEAQHKADQSILRGINQDVSKLTKSIDAANFLKSEGYRYDNEDKRWTYSV